MAAKRHFVYQTDERLKPKCPLRGTSLIRPQPMSAVDHLHAAELHGSTPFLGQFEIGQAIGRSKQVVGSYIARICI